MNWISAGIGAISAMLVGLSAHAQSPSSTILLRSDLRQHQDLSGSWAYSIDPYRTGQADFHGNAVTGRAARFQDINIDQIRQKDPKALFEFNFDKAPRVNLPGAWNAAEPQFRYFDGLMWYQRHFKAELPKSTRAFLHFEAVNYKVSVHLNGQLIGTHEGGFTPFSFEVTKALRPGDNQITIGVDSVHDKAAVPPVVTDWDMYGGVTRPIRLVYVPETYIDDAFIRLNDQGMIEVEAQLNGAASANQALEFSIPGLGIKAKVRANADGRAHWVIKPPKSMQLWSPETPQLYEVSVKSPSDNFRDRVGFRTIKVEGEQLLLNGKPFFTRISLHEEEFGANPARLITADNGRALLSEIKNGLNGNYVRLSHYPHDQDMTRLADEMGLWYGVKYRSIGWSISTIKRHSISPEKCSAKTYIVTAIGPALLFGAWPTKPRSTKRAMRF